MQKISYLKGNENCHELADGRFELSGFTLPGARIN